MHALKNRRRRKKVISVIDENDNDTDTCDQYSDTQAAADVEHLKSTKVNDGNIVAIKEKLKLTLVYRRKLLKDLSIDLLEYFPYFFTNPELVRIFKEY